MQNPYRNISKSEMGSSMTHQSLTKGTYYFLVKRFFLSAIYDGRWSYFSGHFQVTQTVQSGAITILFFTLSTVFNNLHKIFITLKKTELVLM